MKFFYSLLNLLVIVLLTILTQVGGILYIVFRFVLLPGFSKRWKRIWFSLPLFLLFYALNCVLLLPRVATLWNREPLPMFDETLAPGSWMTVICNRQYVHSDLAKTTYDLSSRLHEKFPGCKLIYLDAGFPCLDGFPLVPHLSHNDGRKIDLAFIFTDATGSFWNKGSTWSGYGLNEEPQNGDRSGIEQCEQRNQLYSIMSKVSPSLLPPNFEFDKAKNRWLIQEITRLPLVEKIFIEPHLKASLGLQSDKIRFHGCHAVRHDDHIHFQIAP